MIIHDHEDLMKTARKCLAKVKDADDEVEFAASWLRDQVAQGKRKKFTREDVEVSPILAAMMLKTNAKNRPVRITRIAQLVADMKDGRYQKTHQGIGIDVDGNLFDGQHRLRAVILSGVTVFINVTFGVKPDAFVVTDTHAKRNATDVLALEGVVGAKSVAAAARVLIQRKAASESGKVGRGFRLAQPSTSELLEFVIDNPVLREIAEEARVIRKDISRSVSVAGVAAGLFIIAGVCRDRSQYSDFLKRLRTGVGFETEADPVARLRSRLVKAGHSIDPHETAAIVIKAWNYSQAGKLPQMIVWRPGEPFPEVSR